MSRFVFHVPTGANVLTADHRHLGTVSDTRIGYFQIASANEPWYWLPAYTVESVTPESVHLTVVDGDMARYRHPQPVPCAA